MNNIMMRVVGVTIVFQQHPNATNSSETSVGGASGACGSSGVPVAAEAGCSSRGGSSSGQGCEQPSHHAGQPHTSRESHAKFRHGLLQLMIHTIDPLHDGQSRAGIPSNTLSLSPVCSPARYSYICLSFFLFLFYSCTLIVSYFFNLAIHISA